MKGERQWHTHKIHLHQTTTLTPEQYVAGLTDFSPGRSKVFGNSGRRVPQGALSRPQGGRCHGRLGRIWERLHYDWSNPNQVVLTTTDSNMEWSISVLIVLTCIPMDALWRGRVKSRRGRWRRESQA